MELIDGECETLPDSLVLLLKTILCSESIHSSRKQPKKVIISSIAQDIVYSARGGSLNHQNIFVLAWL